MKKTVAAVLMLTCLLLLCTQAISEPTPQTGSSDLSLRALGFQALSFHSVDPGPIEGYKVEAFYIWINHTQWGETDDKDEENAVLLCQNHGTDNEITIICYPDEKTYLVLSHSQDFRYRYDIKNDQISIEYGEERALAFIRKIYAAVNEQPLKTPVIDFDNTVEAAFGVSANVLYTLPRESEIAATPMPEKKPYMAFYEQLGFSFDDAGLCALYEQHEPYYFSMAIHQPEWGAFDSDWDVEFYDCDVNGYTLRITYEPAENKFHVSADKNDGTASAAYDFYWITGEYGGHPDNVPQVFNNVFGTQGDAFYVEPFKYMDRSLMERFGTHLSDLYPLPEQQLKNTSSLSGLGFTAHEENAGYLYVFEGEPYFDVLIRNHAWEDTANQWYAGGDAVFFTPLSDEYRVVITYYAAEKRYFVKADDNSMGGASFYYDAQADAYQDDWCSDKKLTVAEYFAKACSVPADEVYLHCIKLMEGSISEAFGGLFTADLCALPFKSEAQTPLAAANSLAALGFEMNAEGKTANFSKDNVSVTVNHSAWGIPPMEMEANSIRLYLRFENGELTIGYHPEVKAYVFAVTTNDGKRLDYIYNIAEDSFACDQAIAEGMVRTVLGVDDAENILYQPIQIFHDKIVDLFEIDADALYAMPFDSALPATP